MLHNPDATKQCPAVKNQQKMWTRIALPPLDIQSQSAKSGCRTFSRHRWPSHLAHPTPPILFLPCHSPIAATPLLPLRHFSPWRTARWGTFCLVLFPVSILGLLFHAIFESFDDASHFRCGTDASLSCLISQESLSIPITERSGHGRSVRSCPSAEGIPKGMKRL